MGERPHRLQSWADILTFVCIISLGILIFLLTNAPVGMEALGLMFPVLLVGLLHLMLGPLAILAALLTRRFWRNSWIYGYFALVPLSLLVNLGAIRVGEELEGSRIERMSHPAETRLHAAIEGASLSDVEEALAEGADTSYCYEWNREYRGRSPLQRALTHRRGDMVSCLLAAGADPNLDCNPHKEMHPVLIAAANLNEESLNALLESGAETNPPGQDRSVLVTAIAGGNYSIPYRAENAARHRAARDPEKIRSVVAVLLASGADVNAMPTKAAALHWALAMADGPLIDQLLSAGADPNLSEAQHGRAPLTLALAFGHVDLGRRLYRRVLYSTDRDAPRSGYPTRLSLLRDSQAATPYAMGSIFFHCVVDGHYGAGVVRAFFHPRQDGQASVKIWVNQQRGDPRVRYPR
jgi:ankyrin repeat protein